MAKMGWLRKRRTMVALCLVLVLTALFVQPATVYAAKPDAATTSDSTIQIVPKVTYPFSPYSTPQGEIPKGHSGEQFANITGSLGALPEGMSRYAIVIGSNFEGSTAPDGVVPPLIPPFEIQLNYAENDASDMADLLEYGYGFNVTELSGEDASRDNILDAITQLQAIEERGDEVVFFYSGHGAQRIQSKKEAGTRGWGAIHEGIVTDEGDDNDVGFIWDDELKRAFQHYDTDRIVFIFDSCLSGGMTELAKKGRIVCMATTKTGMAAEAGEFELPDGTTLTINHGLFTYFVLGALSGLVPEAELFDHDSNPQTLDVTIEEAFNFASGTLKAISPDIMEGLALYEQLLGLPEGSLTSLWGTPTIVDRFKQDLLP
ncbi:MAG: caspase family protein [Dehalococcoidales bacterium]|nr:MAG: caspase family protein [Dehalococcoidales bacterium]